MPQSSSSLLALDPELGVLLSAEALAAARRQLVVAVIELPVGPWEAGNLEAANPANPGLLLLSGVLAREVMVRRTISTELLGPGDLVRPWQLERMPPLLELKVSWQVLDPVRAAVLDRRLAQQLNSYPEIRAVLIDRLNERAQRLAVMRAISQMTGVEARLETLFWHLADRWGKVTPDGITVPLPLSHRLLGELVGARRPTVSTALAHLARENRLTRRGDRAWVLNPEAQPEAADDEFAYLTRAA